MNGQLFKLMIAAATLLALSVAGNCDDPSFSDTANQSIQYGEMHEAIGQKKDHVRVLLSDLVKRPHVFAFGALEKLNGEVTIDNGKIVVTRVGGDAQLATVDQTSKLKATMLAGAAVNSWANYSIDQEVEHAKLNEFISKAAAELGIDNQTPFVFSVAGQFSDVRLHVINGA